MAEPFFSVIIPTYNRATLLKRALDSLANQTCKDFEVIVSDDGSTDNTKEIVDSFKYKIDVRYIWGNNWGGPARPRNRGIKIAEGDWICFLDSDDTYLPMKIENLKKYTVDFDLIYHDMVGINVSKNVESNVLSVFDYLLLSGTESLITSSICIRKTIVDAVNGYDETFIHGVEDYDLYLRISKITNRFKHIPLKLGEYHLGDANLHYDVFEMYDGFKKALSKYTDYPLYIKALKKRQLHYFPYLAVFNKDEAKKIFPSVTSFNFSFFAGAILLVIPSAISKFAVGFTVRYFLKEYAYLIK